MIKVLHYIPGFEFGGIESIFLDWFKNIDKNNIQFELLLRTQNDNAPSLIEFKNNNGKYYRLPSIKKPILFKKQVKKFFKEHNNYDILHVHGLTDFFILKYAKKYGIKTIIFHSHAADSSKQLKTKIIYACRNKQINKYVSFPIACSKIAGNFAFKKTKFKYKKIKILNNAIYVGNYIFQKSYKTKIRNELNIDNQFVLGSIGRLTYQKNQFYLLDIFKQILCLKQNSVLLLIGDGPDMPKLKEYSKELGIEGNVKFLSFRKDINCLLSAMDCFLMPSRWEGFPITLIEAQASGLPCYISDTITHESDIVKKLIHRLSIKDDPKIWAKKIIKTKPIDRIKLGRTLINSPFDIKASTKKLENVYKNILK